MAERINLSRPGNLANFRQMTALGNHNDADDYASEHGDHNNAGECAWHHDGSGDADNHNNTSEAW